MRKIVGIHASREALLVRPRSIKKLFLKKGWEESVDLMRIASLAKDANVKVQSADKGFFDKIAQSHQGVLLESSETPQLDWKTLSGEKPVRLVALDGVEDPHNLGAILRTSWLLGVSGILLPGSKAAGLSPTVIKVASGGAEHVPIDVHSNLLNPLNELKDLGFWVYGLSHLNAKDYRSLKFPKKVVWVAGGEGSGLKKTTLGACDELVTIPQKDSNASLNVSVALGIALAHTSLVS